MTILLANDGKSFSISDLSHAINVRNLLLTYQDLIVIVEFTAENGKLTTDTVESNMANSNVLQPIQVPVLYEVFCSFDGSQTTSTNTWIGRETIRMRFVRKTILRE